MVRKVASGLMLALLLIGIQALVLNAQPIKVSAASTVGIVSPLAAAATDGGLNLPSTLVRIEVSNGTESYFNTNLSDVPSGYDVTNGTYPGWCVDTTVDMRRSPAIHEVELYSSSSPPGTLASEKWGMVNYILNHKQGTALDIQQAIWYFINMVGNYSPTSTAAWVIVNDALANGDGFVPGNGQMIAVICYPVALLPEYVQISIIEVAYHTGDTIRPTISIVSPESKTYHVNKIPLTFTVSEPTSWIGFSLDDLRNATIVGNTTLSGLSEGSHRLAVYAKDTAGNTGASETVYFTINTRQNQPFLSTFELIMIAIVIVVIIGGTTGVFLYRKRKTSVNPPSPLAQ